MKIDRIYILNTQIDNLTMKETLNEVSKAIKNKKLLHHTVVNAGKIVALQTDEELKKGVNEADIINADGQAVIWASRILDKPLKERVAGIDLFSNLIEFAYCNNYKIYLLGAKDEVVKKLINKIEAKYSSHIIAGSHHGYFQNDEEQVIVNEIANSGAHMLFVAMSSPKKEIFLNKHKNELNALNFIMGVGGSFDVLAGKTKRAPKWMQNAGLEWFYRFTQEPRRMWKRYLVGNIKFIYLVIKEKLNLNRKLNNGN